MDQASHLHRSPIVVVAAIIRHRGRVLLTRRFDDAHLGGMWEFPGGKVEEGESLEAALIREVREEVDFRIEVDSLYLEEGFTYEERKVHLHFFDCRLVEGMPRCLGVADLTWAFPSELDQFDLPPANARLVERLRQEPR